MAKYLEEDDEYAEARKIERESPHFHSAEKGCKIIPKIQVGVNNNKFMGGYCLTHKKDICRCGWEWHWHGGVYHPPEKYVWQKTQQKKVE